VEVARGSIEDGCLDATLSGIPPCEVETALDSLRRLEENWDGYGASRMEAAALEKARIVWRRLSADLPMPDVVPNSKGTVSFDWESDKGWAHLEIGNKTFAYYVAPEGAEPISRERCLPDDEAILLEAVKAIRQIF